jgi:CheY-like chemotaxis protein
LADENPGQRNIRLDDDIAQLRHSLMNPLTVVMGYAELLSARKDLPEDVRLQVGRILEEAGECVRIIDRSRQMATETRDAGPDAPPPKRRILMVDDEPVIRKLAAEILSPEYEVHGVPDADAAVRALLTEDFDLVLLDLDLGGPIGGKSLYETLQVQQPEVADRVVFVTGGAVTQEDMDFLGRSGRECIAKPFHINQLKDVVARATSL